VPSFELYILDIDGTLVRGAEPIPGAPQAVARLRAKGAKVAFVTNNSSLTRGQLKFKLNRLGFHLQANEVETSATAAAAYLADQRITRVLAIGEPGLRKTLQAAGIESAKTGVNAQAVVAGICRTLTYRKIDAALQQIRAGARFIATNTDATYPIENGRVEPGAGATVGAIQAATGLQPVVIGKPSPTLIQRVLEKTGTKPKDALVVGDRLETDISAGKAAGCPTCLVLTGVTAKAPPGQFTLASVADLV